MTSSNIPRVIQELGDAKKDAPILDQASAGAEAGQPGRLVDASGFESGAVRRRQNQFLSHERYDSHARVVFFQVQNSEAKLKHILETVDFHFKNKEKFIFFVENEIAQTFINELLWKRPQTSFLPHSMSDGESQEWIVITKSKKNVNGARLAFNLCPTPLVMEGSFRIIYELEDLTSPAKQKLSSLRFDRYKEAGFLIEARSSLAKY